MSFQCHFTWIKCFFQLFNNCFWKISEGIAAMAIDSSRKSSGPKSNSNGTSKPKSRNFAIALSAIGLVLLVYYFPRDQKHLAPFKNNFSRKASKRTTVANVENSIQKIVDNKNVPPENKPETTIQPAKKFGFFESLKNLVANPKAKQNLRLSNVIASTGKLFKGQKIREFPLRDFIFDSGRPNVEIRPVPPEPWCTKWSVVTTIFNMSESVMRQAKTHEWCTVIVADKKTPKSYGDSLPLDANSAVTVFLTPEDQVLMKHEFVDIVPWNNFGRKNVGYLYAIEHGGQIIWDFDDDNLLRYWIKGAAPKSFPSLTLSESSTVSVRRINNFTENVVNPLYLLGAPKNLWPRGFPLTKIRSRQTYNFSSKISRETIKIENKLAVLQSVADIQPDLDAVGRLVAADIPVWFQRKKDVAPLLIPKKVYVPYNAQATMHFYKSFGSLLLPITVSGRVSDIWRSYFSQNLFHQYDMQIAYYARPMVVQDRNQHNMLADFQAEEHVYQRAEVLINFLANWTSVSADFCTKMEELWVTLYERGYIELSDVKMMQAWLTALVKIGYRFPGDKKRNRPPKRFAKPVFLPLKNTYDRINSGIQLQKDVKECENLERKTFFVTQPSDLLQLTRSALQNLDQNVVLSKTRPKEGLDVLIETGIKNSSLTKFKNEGVQKVNALGKVYALVCNYACNFWQQLGLPMVYGFSSNSCSKNDWSKLNELLNKSGKFLFTATSTLESRIFEHFTNKIPPFAFNHHKPLSEIRSKTAQNHSSILIFGNQRLAKINGAAMIQGEQILWQEGGFRKIRTFKAAVFVPATMNTTDFQILYSLSVPLFVPYMNSTLAQKSIFGSKACKSREYPSHIKSIHPYDPYGLGNDTEGQRYWMQFTDYYSYPHITYFSDERDLEEKLRTAKLRNVRKLMRMENKQRRLKLDILWCDIVKRFESKV